MNSIGFWKLLYYHDDVKNPAPGDLIMATAEQMSHPAYTMKESIGAAFLLFGKVKQFTYERYLCKRCQRIVGS